MCFAATLLPEALHGPLFDRGQLVQRFVLASFALDDQLLPMLLIVFALFTPMRLFPVWGFLIVFRIARCYL